MSMPRATVARNNSLKKLPSYRKKKGRNLGQNQTQRGYPSAAGPHRFVVGKQRFLQTMSNPVKSRARQCEWVGRTPGQSSYRGMGWSRPEGGAEETWARAPGKCPEQGERKQTLLGI